MRCIPPLAQPLAALPAAAAVLLILCTPADAAYRYTYTGNVFTMTTQVFPGEPGDPLGSRSFSLQAMSAEVLTTAPLAAGTATGDVLSFTLTLTPSVWGELPRTLTYPTDYPPPYPCSFCAPTLTGSLLIGATGPTGLPSQWNLWIGFDQAYPTGRHETLTLSTTETLDSVSGGYEAFVAYGGGLANSPGYWSMALAVPEPFTPALLIGGIGLFGVVAARARARHV